MEVGSNNVTLRLGKQANRRQLQFALQSLVAVFGMLDLNLLLFKKISSRTDNTL